MRASFLGEITSPRDPQIVYTVFYIGEKKMLLLTPLALGLLSIMPLTVHVAHR